MSILFPDRNGVWSATEDSRMSFDSTNLDYLTEAYGVLLIGCGNPLLHQDYFSEYDGANNSRFNLFGNRQSTSPGYTLLRFSSYAEGQIASRQRFTLRFRPINNGGEQSTLTVISETVTYDNTAYVAIERNGDDYAIHLYDANGVKTAGAPVTHNAGSFGMTLRSTAKTVYIGAGDVLQASQTNGHWRSLMENVTLVEQSTPFTDMDGAIANIITGSNPVVEFGAPNVKLWRTLEDLTSAGLAANPSATSDTYPEFVDAAASRKLPGSPIAAISTQSVRLNERKYNFAGLQSEQTSTDLNVSGDYFGSVTNVEGRLLNVETLAEVQPWQTLDSAVTGGYWSGTFTGVSAGEYAVELRPSNATANVYRGRNPWAVAYVIAWMGQSQDQIAFQSTKNIEGLLTLPDTVPATARGYVIDIVRNSTLGFRPSYMRFSQVGNDDYSDGLIYAQIEWEKQNPGVPVVWMKSCIEGSSIQNWLNNEVYQQGYQFVGDGATFGTGHVTDTFLTLGTDKINIAYSWGTSNLTSPSDDYDGFIHGWLFDEPGITDYSGPSFSHVTDMFDSNFGLFLTPLTRAITTVSDNFTADPVDDDYSSSTSFRERQLALFTGWTTSRVSTNKVVIGPSVNDMHISAGGGPHQPDQTEGLGRFIGGTPRLGTRIGIASSWLVSTDTFTVPTLGEGAFANNSKTSFAIPVLTGSGGALKNADTTQDASGFELSEDGGTTWNRKGFTGVIAGNTVIISRSSGDWTAVAEGDLQWRYHKGGPYSYGSSFVAEQDADVNKALYATFDAEGGRGLPVQERTNGNGGFSVSEPVVCITINNVTVIA